MAAPPVPRIAVAVPPGTGGSTWLGLLYLALLREASGADPRISLALAAEALDRLQRSYAALAAGRYPDPDPSSASDPVTLRIAVATGTAGRVWSALRGRGAERSFGTVELDWVPIPAADLAAAAPPTAPLGPRLRRCLSADRWALLVDAEPPSVDPGLADALLQRLVEERGRNRRPDGTADPVDWPGLVLTRADRVPKARRPGLGLPAELPERWDGAQRSAWFERLRADRFPKTSAWLRSRAPDAAPWLLSTSWCAPDATDPSRIAVRSVGPGRWEPVHSRGEFDALIPALVARAR